MEAKKTTLERFKEKIVVNAITGCWEWTSSKSAAGYGMLSTKGNGKSSYVYAHRFSYELKYGPIPEGLHIDHLCWHRGCVNPDHMEPVTPEENHRRIGMQSPSSRKLQEDLVVNFPEVNPDESSAQDGNGISTAVCAAKKGVSRQSVFLAVERGEIPAERVGKTYIIRESDCDAWTPNPRRMEAGKQRRKPTDPPTP